jgi:hypothetical protein
VAKDDPRGELHYPYSNDEDILKQNYDPAIESFVIGKIPPSAIINIVKVPKDHPIVKLKEEPIKDCLYHFRLNEKNE